MEWEPRPEQFGAFSSQLPRDEGESLGVPHDPYTRTPGDGERRAYSLEKNYAFVNVFNSWVCRSDWPKPVEFTYDNKEHERREDEYERALFLVVASCIAEADPYEHRWHRALWEKMPREQRLNPPDSVRHGAGLAQHILDALCCAVDALADGKRIPAGVWQELTGRGGIVSLRGSGDSPHPSTRKFGVVGRMPWWQSLYLEPKGILHRAADSIVGSFFLYLLSVQLGGPKGPRLKRCAETGCKRVLVASGRHSYCQPHQKVLAAKRKERRRDADKEERREWRRLKGNLAARRGAFLKWRSKTKEARARWDRSCSTLRNDGQNPAVVGYDVFLTVWKTSK